VNHSFLDEHSRLTSAVHDLNPQVKILVTVAFVILVVSTPSDAGWAYAAYGLSLGLTLGLSRLPLAHFFKRLLIVLPFVAAVAVFIPLLPEGPASVAAGVPARPPDGHGGPSYHLPEGQPAGGYNLGFAAETPVSRWLVFWNVLIKALLGAAATILLTSTTPFPKLLQALGHLRVPQLLVIMLSFTYRYLFVLVDEAQRMKRACDSRGYSGRWLGHTRVFGHLIGTLFLRSYERGERVYLAMLARGFDGGFRQHYDCRLHMRDAFCGVAAAVLLAGVRLWAV
jgi:cobalt/nickel transport system permease protein